MYSQADKFILQEAHALMKAAKKADLKRTTRPVVKLNNKEAVNCLKIIEN